MPVKVMKKKGKYRIVETGGKVARGRSGTPVDGGGHGSKGKAAAQARAINASIRGSK